MAGMRLLHLLAAASAVVACDAFAPRTASHRHAGVGAGASLTMCNEACGDGSGCEGVVRTFATAYETTLASDEGPRKPSMIGRLRGMFRTQADDGEGAKPRYRFTYECAEMVLGRPASASATTAVLLVHPIGVGIGRWYYDRLLNSLAANYGDLDHQLAFVAPDLLGSGTASGPVDAHGDEVRKLPLLNVTDWTEQVTHLMAEYERKSEAQGHRIGRWTVVANGGCAPIALQVASTSRTEASPFQAALTNVIVSSPPRLPFFLDGTDPAKVRKSYRTLSGMAGRAFWWYALRKDGKFIQRFSERNLVGDASNLGEEWTPNCVKTARLHNGTSRYSTFAFLAGTLQDGCAGSLEALRGSNVTIDFIRGKDGRRNRARSWFWSRKKKGKSEEEGKVVDIDDAPPQETIQQYVQKNGNRGKEVYIGGRISLAWEDPGGYAKALLELLCE